MPACTSAIWRRSTSCSWGSRDDPAHSCTMSADSTSPSITAWTIWRSSAPGEVPSPDSRASISSSGSTTADWATARTMSTLFAKWW